MGVRRKVVTPRQRKTPQRRGPSRTQPIFALDMAGRPLYTARKGDASARHFAVNKPEREYRTGGGQRRRRHACRFGSDRKYSVGPAPHPRLARGRPNTDAGDIQLRRDGAGPRHRVSFARSNRVPKRHADGELPGSVYWRAVERRQTVCASAITGEDHRRRVQFPRGRMIIATSSRQ